MVDKGKNGQQHDRAREDGREFPGNARGRLAPIQNGVGRQPECDHHAGVDVAADAGAKQDAGDESGDAGSAVFTNQQQHAEHRKGYGSRVDISGQQDARRDRTERPGDYPEQGSPTSVTFPKHRIQGEADRNRQQIAQHMKTGQQTGQCIETEFGENRSETDRVVDEAVAIDQIDEVMGIAQVVHRIGEIVLRDRRQAEQHKGGQRQQQDRGRVLEWTARSQG